MKNKLVSVIMPTYNRDYIISMAINSILEQTYKNLELIIVDDCSNDETEKIVTDFKDKRIQYVKLPKKMGANYARNLGLQKARGEYITFQDSDDYSMPERIEKELSAIEKEQVDLVFSSFFKANNEDRGKLLKGNQTSVKLKLVPKNKVNSKDIFNTILYKNIITTQVLLGKKEVFEKEKFDNSLTRFQDWDLMIRVAKKFKVFHINEPLLYMFIQNDSITKNNIKGYESLEIIYKKYFDWFGPKQKCRILFRIGIFKTLEGIDATEDFKQGLKYYKNPEYLSIYISYRLKLFQKIYHKIKK